MRLNYVEVLPKIREAITVRDAAVARLRAAKLQDLPEILRIVAGHCMNDRAKTEFAQQVEAENWAYVRSRLAHIGDLFRHSGLSRGVYAFELLSSIVNDCGDALKLVDLVDTI